MLYGSGMKGISEEIHVIVVKAYLSGANSNCQQILANLRALLQKIREDTLKAVGV